MHNKKDAAGLVVLAPRKMTLAAISEHLAESGYNLGDFPYENVRGCDLLAHPGVFVASVAYALLDQESAPDHGRGVLS